MSWQTLNVYTNSAKAVGIEHGDDGSASLHVPIAYADASECDDAETKRRIFVDIFQLLDRFSDQFSSAKLLTKGESLHSPTQQTGQTRVHDQEPTNPTGYYMLDLLSLLMAELADPTILTLANRQQVRHGYLDTRQISRYLHLALYQDDGSPVFEGMPVRQTVVREGSSDLIGLAAWLVRDLLKYFYQIDLLKKFENNTAAELDIIADTFATKYLPHEMDCVMIDAASAKRLREVLHAVENNTPFKPPKFEAIFDTSDKLLKSAVEKNGQFMGVEKFYNVWESLCLLHATRTCNLGDIFTCDAQFLLAESSTRIWKEKWQRNLAIFDENATARRPDLVISPHAGCPQWTIVDFKYYQVESMQNFPFTCGRGKEAIKERLSEKHRRDLTSGEIYRFLLAIYLQKEDELISHEDIRLEFWIPGVENSAPNAMIIASESGKFSNLFYRTICMRDAIQSYITADPRERT